MFVFSMLKTALIGSIIFIVLIFATLVFLIGGTAVSSNKDDIISGFNNTIQNIGNNVLTTDRKLEGDRVFGKDKYTGIYNASYKDFTGEEVIFRGTELDREYGNKLNLNINVNKISGKIKIYMNNGIEQNVLIEDTGEYKNTITIPGGSNYFIVKCTDFNGEINVKIE